MALSSRQKEQLGQFLGELPTASALKLFAALEADRFGGPKNGLGINFPYDELLGDLRKRLLERGGALPDRKRDARRIFFTPFEDFFIAARDGKKRKGKIARASLAPIWRLMMRDKNTNDAALAAASFDDALRAGRETKMLERALFVSAEAGLQRICAEAEDDDQARARIEKMLGAQSAYDDLCELRALLGAVDILKRLHELIPSAAPSLGEDQLYDLRALFISAYEQSKSAGTYLLLSLKGRLERPWRALGVYYHLAGGADDKLLSAKHAFSVMAESLIEDLEFQTRALEELCSGRLDAHSAMMRARYFADFADGLARQAAKAGDNVYLNRVEACREIAAGAHDRFVEQALGALRRVMPVREGGGSSRLASLRPDIAKPITAALLEEASDAARLLAGAPALADRLGADQAYARSMVADAADAIENFAKDLVIEIRAGEGDERKAARRMLDHVLGVGGPLLDADATGLLRDRAAAAAMAV